ncbi:hypothetical protein [Candidatus Pristimantibacillus sp. PTI5]|uniref:hypothetical protein n=1 Tax=Candidatus Pristimantibacillus sp. PTI5 TaxID=3400422 RepID=UPI003B02071D
MEIKLNPFKSPLTQSQMLYVIAITVFAILNVAALFLYVLPELGDLKEAKKGVVQYSAALQTAQSEYATEKITDVQIEELLNRVPVKRADSVNIEIFRELAQMSGTPLGYITQKNGNDEGQTAESGVSPNGTVSTSFEVNVVGHLPNMLLFIDHLHNYPRLFALQKWTMAELSKETINQDYPDLYTFASIQKDKAVLSLRMTIQTYIFPQFADSFTKKSEAEDLSETAA